MDREQTYTHFLTYLLYHFDKEGFAIDTFNIDQLSSLYCHYVKGKETPENCRQFLSSARGIICKTTEQQQKFVEKEASIWNGYFNQLPQISWYVSAFGFVKKHWLISSLILILLTTCTLFAIKYRHCLTTGNIKSICACISSGTNADSINHMRIQTYIDSLSVTFSPDIKGDAKTFRWSVSGKQSGKHYFKNEVTDYLYFPNPALNGDLSDTSYKVVLTHAASNEPVLSDSIEFIFDKNNPASDTTLSFHFVYPEPLLSNIEDLKTAPDKETDWEMLTLIMIIVLIIYYFLRQNGLLTNRELSRTIILQKDVLSKEANLKNLGGPYYLPLSDASQPTHQMYENTEIRDIVNELNKKRDFQLNKIDVHATIKSTLKNAGILKIVTKAAYRKPGYLLIVKADNNRNHHFRFIKDILGFIERFIDIEVFVYDYNINHLISKKTNKLYTLTDLHNHYYNYQFVLWGDGYDLIDIQRDDLYESVRKNLDAWESKILLSHLHQMLWGKKEKILSQYFYIDKADIRGILKTNTYYKYEFLENIEPKIAALNKRLEETVPFPNIQEFENQLTGDIHQQKDICEYYVQRLSWYYTEQEFQLLACCALYENLYWDVTKALAFALYGKAFFTDELVARLCHLPWFISGRIPEMYRDILVKEIDGANKKKALDRLKEIVADSTAKYKNGFAHDNMKLQLAKTYDDNKIPIDDAELENYLKPSEGTANEKITIEKTYRVKNRRPWLIEIIASSMMSGYKINITKRPFLIRSVYHVDRAYNFRKKAKSWMVLLPFTIVLFFSLIPFVEKNSVKNPFTMNDKVVVCKSAKDSARFYNKVGDMLLQSNRDSAALFYDKAYTVYKNDTSVINLFALTEYLEDSMKARYLFADTVIAKQLNDIATHFNDSTLYYQLMRLVAGFSSISRNIHDTLSISSSLYLLSAVKQSGLPYFDDQVTANYAYLEKYIKSVSNKDFRNRLTALFDFHFSKVGVTIHYRNDQMYETVKAMKSVLQINTKYEILIAKSSDPISKNEIIYFSRSGMSAARQLKELIPEFVIRQGPPISNEDSNNIHITVTGSALKPLIYIQYNNKSLEPMLRTIKISMNRGSRFTCDEFEFRTNFTQNEIRYYDDSFKDSIKYLQYYLDSAFSPNKVFKVNKVARRSSKASAEIWIFEKNTLNACKSYTDSNGSYGIYFEKDRTTLSTEATAVLSKLKQDIVESQRSFPLQVDCYSYSSQSADINQKIAREYGKAVAAYFDRTLAGMEYKFYYYTSAPSGAEDCKGWVRITLGNLKR